jgi:hypothetical protein
MNRFNVAKALAMMTFLSGCTALGVTMYFREGPALGVSIIAGGSNIVCAVVEAYQSGTIKQFDPHESRRRRLGLYAFMTPILLWSFLMVLIAFFLARTSGTGLKVAVMIEMLGLSLSMLWLIVRQKAIGQMERKL